MESQTDTNNQFKRLDCDTDLLLIEKDTFTVGRFKELLRIELQRIFSTRCLPDGQSEGKSVIYLCDKLLSGLKIGALNLSIRDMRCIFPREGINCQLLEIGSQGWQKGRIRMEMCIPNYHQSLILEFCPDEPTTP
ncbi:hypothetical protein BCD67_04510 [Oscillatoriales cyanobacterium USR001]|nr:hypothetical protein BCD67_04510 [Oscillatoriales cyanobacterium USR001]